MVGRAEGEMRIGILGLGHVGLPTALGFAELGWPVIGFDDDRAKAERIAAGQAPFFEPGIDELLHKHLQSGRFSVAPDPEAAITQSHVLFVCVGTPQREDGSADLSQVENVARTIAAALNGYKVIVEKSTTPVRTAEQIDRTIRRYRSGDHEFDVAVNPEFMREGTSLSDFFNPDRIVIGVDSDRARDLLLKIYEPLVRRFGPPGPTNEHFVITNLNTAEIIKHAANAFLATKISFINMIADLCDAVGADVLEVARGLGMDPRIGAAFLQAGQLQGGQIAKLCETPVEHDRRAMRSQKATREVACLQVRHRLLARTKALGEPEFRRLNGGLPRNVRTEWTDPRGVDCVGYVRDDLCQGHRTGSALAAIVGLMVGTILAFLMEYFGSSRRCPRRRFQRRAITRQAGKNLRPECCDFASPQVSTGIEGNRAGRSAVAADSACQGNR